MNINGIFLTVSKSFRCFKGVGTVSNAYFDKMVAQENKISQLWRISLACKDFLAHPELRLVHISKIKLHESYEESRVKKLYDEIINDDYLKCPLLVIPMENGQYFVIDGVHRFNSLCQAGCKYIPVQVVNSAEISLSTWGHEIPKTSWMKEFCLDSSLKWQNEIMTNTVWVAAILDDEGNKSWLVPTRPSQDINERLNHWHKIVNSYLGRTQIKRVVLESDELPSAGHLRFIYPVWRIEEIEATVKLKTVLPPGTTRFIVKNKLENLHIPLELLSVLPEYRVVRQWPQFSWNNLASLFTKYLKGSQLEELKRSHFQSEYQGNYNG